MSKEEKVLQKLKTNQWLTSEDLNVATKTLYRIIEIALEEIERSQRLTAFAVIGLKKIANVTDEQWDEAMKFAVEQYKKSPEGEQTDA
jgi:hypothetical protein